MFGSIFWNFAKWENMTFLQASNEYLVAIPTDWAFNMNRSNGTDYKKEVVKTTWNISAKLLQKYFEDFCRKIYAPKDIIFDDARKACIAKRRELQVLSEKNPVLQRRIVDGLQKKFFQISAVELVQHGNKATFCVVELIKRKVDNYVNLQVMLNTTPYSPKLQRAEKSIPLHTVNIKKSRSMSSASTAKDVKQKTQNVKTNRMFLSPNSDWMKTGIWYKTCAIGLNQPNKWTCLGMLSSGTDFKKVKITNHSNCSSAISNLTKSGANLQEINQITGHSSSEFFKPYLKLSNEHHFNIVEKMRKTLELYSRGFSQITSRCL